MNSDLSLSQQQFLLKCARHEIAAQFNRQKYQVDPEIASEALFAQKRGVFVTLSKQGHLRGCIGYPLPYKPLLEAVLDNALSAAFHDSRFPPLTVEELPLISIEISVLTLPKTVNSPNEVRVGVDGIIVSWQHKRGLLLPQVPLEQGWDLEAYLDYGCVKASLPADQWRSGSVQIEVFQAHVFNERGLL